MDRRLFLRSAVATSLSTALPWQALLAAGPITAELPAIQGSGGTTVLKPNDLEDLRRSLRGSLLLRGDTGYEQARRVLNQSINKYPALVVQPTGAADVRTAVNFARDHELLLAVKCGGHSFAGKSTCDGGMQIDLSRLRGARVDPAARLAYVAGGSLLGDLDHEALALGLVTTAGTVSHTGVGGLTLGAGFGRLARRFGLALDNLKAVDIVTADGRLLHASAEENPELFWGVRGGGGNFGIVTSFVFGLHEMQRQVLGGDLIYPFSRARELLEFYADYSSRAADELYLDYWVDAPADGKDAICGLHACYSGSAERADAVLEPIRKLGKPVDGGIAPIDYELIQRSWDQTDVRNTGEYLKSGFINDFPASLISAIADGFQADPGRGTTVFFQQSGGAIGRVAADATAFPHRRSTHNMFAVASWELGRDPASHIRYVKDYWGKLEPFTDGYYTNEVGGEAQGLVDANYQGNLGRLRQLKKTYDPANLFRLNANITPA